MIDTVLFDIGGTLITQTRNPVRSLLDAQYIIERLKEYGVEISLSSEDLAKVLSERSEQYKHLGERTLKELSPTRIWNEHLLSGLAGDKKIPDVLAKEFSFCHDFLRLDNRPREGVRACLETLRDMGLKIGIITNTISDTFADHIIREYGIEEFFPVIVKSCETGIRKPDRRIFDHAMSLMGTSSERTCYVGDTVSRDVLGSRNAGLAMCIMITNPSVAHRDTAFKDKDSPKADFIIDKLMEIPPIIRDFNAKTKEKP